MSNATLAWSLAFTISIAVLMLSDFDTITFPTEAAGQKQENSTSVLANNNDTTIKKANTPINNNLINEGISLLILRKYNEALNLFDRVLAVDPNDVKTLTNKGNVLDTLGKHQEAIWYYDKALPIEPNDVVALQDKGSALDLLGRYNEAIKYYDKALAIKPTLQDTINDKRLSLEALIQTQIK